MSNAGYPDRRRNNSSDDDSDFRDIQFPQDTALQQVRPRRFTLQRDCLTRSKLTDSSVVWKALVLVDDMVEILRSKFVIGIGTFLFIYFLERRGSLFGGVKQMIQGFGVG